jgi:hypothetical protein
MRLAVDVPLTTVLADLDETLKGLLREELGRHGFDTVQVAFDAPTREWSSHLSKPVVNVFLYDLHEAADLRASSWAATRAAGRTVEGRPPMVMECSYAVTAWTKAVEDEHRLLSHVLAILFAYPELPAERLRGQLANGSAPWRIKGRIGQSKSERSDFWTAIGGQYKVSIEYVVQLTVESGARLERGPDARTQTLRTGSLGSPTSSVTEVYRSNGSVTDHQGVALAEVEVQVPQLGRSVKTRTDGRFVVDRVPAGRHRVVARAADGREAAGEIEVPGTGIDLVIGAREAGPDDGSSGRH